MAIREKVEQLLTPDEQLSSIYELNLGYLQKKGIKGLVFDVENTLLAPWEKNPSIKCVDWLKSIQGYGFKVCLLSNDRNVERVTAFAKLFNVPAMHSALKPFTWSLSKAIAEMLVLKPAEVAVIGDTLLTDILPGNWLSAHTILVDPIAEHQDPMFDWLTRRTGKALAKVITRKR